MASLCSSKHSLESNWSHFIVYHVKIIAIFYFVGLNAGLWSIGYSCYIQEIKTWHPKGSVVWDPKLFCKLYCIKGIPSDVHILFCNCQRGKDWFMCAWFAWSAVCTLWHCSNPSRAALKSDIYCLNFVIKIWKLRRFFVLKLTKMQRLLRFIGYVLIYGKTKTDQQYKEANSYDSKWSIRNTLWLFRAK